MIESMKNPGGELNVPCDRCGEKSCYTVLTNNQIRLYACGDKDCRAWLENVDDQLKRYKHLSAIR